MKDATYDVILAGGGVMGCAAAYYLRRSDPGIRVAIIEKDPSYSRNSTTLSDGNTRLQFNLEANVRMSQFGLEALETFADDMAVADFKPDPGFRQQGNLFLADETGRADALAGVSTQQRLGAEVDWLEPEEIALRYALYNPETFAGGAFGRLDGTMDPHAILMGYRSKAVDLGVDFLEAEVARVIVEDGHTVGVELADGRSLQAATVVNSAGAWGTDLARTAGIELPMHPVRRHVFVLETKSVPEVEYPLTVFPSGTYLIHEHGNRFTCGKSMDDDPVGFDFNFDRSLFYEKLWEELVEYVPSFDRLKLAGGWSGLYAVNHFDGNVLLGEWPGVRGFLLVNGFSGHGFQHCHALGRHLSEMIRGVPTTLDLSIFDAARVLENQPVFEGRGKLV